MALHPLLSTSPYDPLLPDQRWFHAAEELRATTRRYQREFKTMLDAEIHHTVMLDGSGTADYRSVVGFFARQLLKDLRLVGEYEILYPKVRDFMSDYLFTPSPVNLEDPVVPRNLSEPDAGKILYDSFKFAINALTIQETGVTRIEDRIHLREMRPFRTEHRPYLNATKIHLYPHCRRTQLRRLRTPLRRLPGIGERRGRVRLKLFRDRVQSGLSQSQR